MDNEIRFKLNVSLDKDRFFRRCCPVCGLEFKTLADPSDISEILSEACRRIYEEPDDVTTGVSSNNLFCPYCGKVNESSEFLTDETRRYLIQYAKREIVSPAINKLQNEIEKMFGSNKLSNDFFQSSVSTNRHIKPVRPISGPEPPDMKSVFFLCCEKRIKILTDWESSIYCIECGKE